MNKTTIQTKAPAPATNAIETDAGSLADEAQTGTARWSTARKLRGQLRREFMVGLVHSQLTAAGSAMARDLPPPAADGSTTAAAVPTGPDPRVAAIAKGAWDMAEAALREAVARGFLA